MRAQQRMMKLVSFVAGGLGIAALSGCGGGSGSSAAARSLAVPTSPKPAPIAPTAAPNTAAQSPSYTASIAVPPNTDHAALTALSKITPEQARTAALKQVLGTVTKVELDDENGYLVYSVDICSSTGQRQDVKVDAGNGRVLHVDVDDGETADATSDTDSVEHGVHEKHEIQEKHGYQEKEEK